jgi:ParB family transcriptional regulator, chromosome partitioning protein
MARQTLGRGLSALLGEDSEPKPPAGTLEIGIHLISPNPEQPRNWFSEDKLDELAKSIIANGIVQPIVVREKDGEYQIIAGERRWRAAQRAGLKKIPAVIKDVPDEKLLEIALVENIQRQELNPIEEATAFKNLIETVGLTQEIVADRVGKDRTAVATAMRLLKLSTELQNKIAVGYLTAGHGRALLMTDDPKIQRTVAATAIDLGLSVRETEKAVKRLVKGETKKLDTPKQKPAVDPNVKAAETRLMRRFGTHVRIMPSGKGAGGKIEIEYYGEEDLNRVFQIMMHK